MPEPMTLQEERDRLAAFAREALGQIHDPDGTEYWVVKLMRQHGLIDGQMRPTDVLRERAASPASERAGEAERDALKSDLEHEGSLRRLTEVAIKVLAADCERLRQEPPWTARRGDDA